MSESLAARWEHYNEAGRRSFSQGQLAEAEEAFQAAILEGELLGPDSPQLATSLHALGQLRSQAKDFAAAEPLLTRALAIRERAFGSEGHVLVPSLNSLAALYEVRGEFDHAESSLRRALGISEHHLGPAHPEVSVGLNNLAKLYFKRRDFAKADRLLLRLLEIKRGLGKDHPEIATVLGSLAKLRQVLGKYEQAEQLLRQALAIRERCFAPNDPVIATTLENVADCCAPVPGRVADAIALRERALAIREHSSGTLSPSLDTPRAKLDELRRRASSDTGIPPTAAPRRNSQEIPSPLEAMEPAFLRDEARRTPQSSDLPWIDVDGPDRNAADQLDADMVPPISRSGAPLPSLPPISRSDDSSPYLPPISRPMGAPKSLPPISRVKTPSASVTPVGVPRQGGPVIGNTFGAPPAPIVNLGLSDSIAPEPPSRKTNSGHAGRYVAPTESRGLSSGRSGRYVAPDLDSTSDAGRSRTPRMPDGISRRGSSKRLVVAGIVVILLAAAAWAAKGRLGAAPAPTSRPTAAPAPARSGVAPSAAPGALQDEPTQSVAIADTVSRPLANQWADTVAHEASPETRDLMPSATVANADSGRAARRATRDSARRADLIADERALALMPLAGVGEGIDSVTSTVEQSTKSKIETAQKSRIELKTPVFRKP